MKVVDLLEDAQAPLVWSMVGKILRSGASVRTLLSTWDNVAAKNNPPGYYTISVAIKETDKRGNVQYRLYFVENGKAYTSWFELMQGDDEHLSLKKDVDGVYLLRNKDGTPLAV